MRDRDHTDVVSLAVLTDTNARFRPQTFRQARWGRGIAFRFPMVKRLDEVTPERWADLEASDNVFALVVMAQIRAKVTRDAGLGQIILLDGLNGLFMQQISSQDLSVGDFQFP